MKNKISKKKIESLTQSKDVSYTIEKVKFNYAGHMARMEENWWNKRATYGCPLRKNVVKSDQELVGGTKLELE